MRKNLYVWLLITMLLAVLGGGCGRNKEDGFGGAENPASGMEQDQTVDPTGTESAMGTEEDSSQLQLGSAVEIPESFDGQLAETDAHAGIERVVAKYCGVAKEDYAKVRYYYNYVDLNGDSKNEILALVIGQDVAGIEGNLLLWMDDVTEAGEKEEAVRQAFRQVGVPIYISNHMTGGYRDLIIADSQNTGGASAQEVNEGNAGHTVDGEATSLQKTAGLDDTTGENGTAFLTAQSYTLLVWTGEKYQELEEGAPLSGLGGYEGTAVLTNNLESDRINDNYHFLGESM